jgi:hypothetical protein
MTESFDTFDQAEIRANELSIRKEVEVLILQVIAKTVPKRTSTVEKI